MPATSEIEPGHCSCLFRTEDLSGAKHQELRFDLSGFSRDAFWKQAAARILTAPEHYAGSADTAEDMPQRLFAEDAAASFAFFDLCRQRFDAVVLNPAFGAAGTRAESYIGKAYPRSKNDLLAACVERGLGWLHSDSLLAAITSRTVFLLTSYRKWCQGVVLLEPVVVADLRCGVMEAAMVKAAAYVLRNHSSDSQPRDNDHA